MNIDHRDGEVQTLRKICAMAYQLAGAVGASEQVLDCLSQAAEGVYSIDPLDCLPIELNPVELIDAEFDAAQASADPRAVDTLVEALDHTLKVRGLTIVPAEDLDAEVRELSAVARIAAVDEYGPQIEWTTHWVDLIGKTLYVNDDAAMSASKEGA